MRTPTPAELRAKVETRSLPAMPARKVYPSGRIGWPDVCQYRPRDREGVLLDLPPPEPHHVVVHDLPAYELLVATGRILAPEHTGRAAAAMVDNRKTVA